MEGKKCLKPDRPGAEFDSQYPMYFQGQECFLVSCDGLHVELDRKVKWKDTHDMRLVQKQVIADHLEMQRATGEAWSTL